MVDARKQKVYDDIYQELEVLAMKDNKLHHTFRECKEFSPKENESISAYESQLKYMIDKEAKIADAKYHGKRPV